MNAVVENPLGPEEAIGLIKDSIETADQALDLYNKVLDQIVPWGTFEETLTRIDEYKEDYSAKAAELVGKVQTKLQDSKDCYFQAVSEVYIWCGVAKAVLPAYVNSITDPEKAASQLPLILKVLDKGITSIDRGIEQLQNSSMSFNAASGELLALDKKLEEDFNTKSEYFKQQEDKIRKEAYGGAAAGVVAGPFGLIIAYSIAAGVVEGKLIPELKAKLSKVKDFFVRIRGEIESTQSQISEAKLSLQSEATALGELKEEIETAQIFIESNTDNALKDEVIDAANKLVESCISYRDRHQAKAVALGWPIKNAQQLIEEHLLSESDGFFEDVSEGVVIDADSPSDLTEAKGFGNFIVGTVTVKYALAAAFTYMMAASIKLKITSQPEGTKVIFEYRGDKGKEAIMEAFKAGSKIKFW